MDRADIDAEIARIGGLTFTIGNGRGLVGCTCGMAWRPRDSTFELLAYRPESRWGTKRIYETETIMEVEHGLSSTFNSWEDRTCKVAIVPSTPCPVMYGLRGDDENDLLKGHDIIRTEPQDRWIIFLTNQGTDDHIIHNPAELIPNRSYLIRGTVSSRTRHIEGGHVFFDIETKWGKVQCGVYEPSKEFRMAADWLCPGDEVEVFGELRENPRTLNVEKIHVISIVPEFNKVSNPICPICFCTMKSTGKNKKFKCKKCGTKSYVPVMQPVRRQIVPGWYESPIVARRHLSKPLKRMGVIQPVEFVNGRS